MYVCFEVNVCLPACMYVGACVCVCMYVCVVYVYMYVCMHACMCMSVEMREFFCSTINVLTGCLGEYLDLRGMK
jgi:hypothetical protein